MKKFYLILMLFLVNSFTSLPQSINYQEFLDISSEVLNTEELKKIRKEFPENFYITALDIGDISGDGKNDFAIGIMPPRSGKRIFISFYIDSNNTYKKVFADTLKFHELPIEIGFSIEDHVCFITHKISERNWEIKGYSYLNNEFSEYDYYETGKYKLTSRLTLGEETYENYYDLNSFKGYFNFNTLKEMIKYKFISLPVYEKTRNIYKNYLRSAEINENWLWEDSLILEPTNFGKLKAEIHNSILTLSLKINEENFKNLNSAEVIKYEFYFDTELRRVKLDKRKKVTFRKSIDETVSGFEILYNPQKEYYELKISNGKSIKLKPEDLSISFQGTSEILVSLPVNIIKPEKQNELGFYTSINLKMVKGKDLFLKNSNGFSGIPSSYGRLIFIGDNEFYGNIENPKLSFIIEELKKNAVLNTD